MEGEGFIQLQKLPWYHGLHSSVPMSCWIVHVPLGILFPLGAGMPLWV